MLLTLAPLAADLQKDTPVPDPPPHAKEPTFEGPWELELSSMDSSSSRIAPRNRTWTGVRIRVAIPWEDNTDGNAGDYF